MDPRVWIMLAVILVHFTDATNTHSKCGKQYQVVAGSPYKCPPTGPQDKREKPEPPEKPERPELPESEYDPEEPDSEDPNYRDIGRPTSSSCPTGDKLCQRDNANDSVGILGVYKAAAFIGLAILLAITVTVISLVVYCVWRRRRDRELGTHSCKLQSSHNGYATPAGKCVGGGTGVVCTCINAVQPCCQPATGCSRGQHGDTAGGNPTHHQYAGPMHNAPQPCGQTNRPPQAIPYAQSAAYPARGGKGDNDGNPGGYMGLIKSRPNGDSHPPTTVSQPRQGITQAVNHEYHLPHHATIVTGKRVNPQRVAQQSPATNGVRTVAQQMQDEPYYFKLNDDQDISGNQPQRVQDRNIPDVIANRPAIPKGMADRHDGRYEHISDQPTRITLAPTVNYDSILVQDGSSQGKIANFDTDESYDKLDRSRQSFRPLKEQSDYNTISLDVLKI